jgi:hypothetical protein
LLQPSHMRLLVLTIVTLLSSLSMSGGAIGASVEQETLQHLAALRAVKADSTPEQMQKHNEQMDEAWQFYHANKDQVLPVLRRELAAELRRKPPAQLLLLDVASFLFVEGDEADHQRSLQALLAIDTNSQIIQANFDQLFRLTHGMSSTADAKLLPFIDRTFLTTERSVFVPEHSLTLNPTLICAFLYGGFGAAGESHLQPRLKDRDLTERVLEILKWIGSPDSVSAVEAAMPAKLDHDLFARELTFMMTNGGLQGREAMLQVDRARLDAQAKQFYEKVRPAIEAQDYAQLRKRFDKFSGETRLSEEQIKERLALMYRNYGKDNRLNPQALLDSSLGKDYLIGELSRIRSRMFSRASDEALSDVELTNAVLNTLRYRDH